MRIRYNTLFRLKLTASYYAATDVCRDLAIVPTANCKRLLTKYKLLSRTLDDGMVICYRTDTPPASVAPLYPIASVEKFYFIITATNSDFWFYADVNGWDKEAIFLLQNPSFNSTANQVFILNAPLTSPISFYPMAFRYEVPLQATPGLLEVRDSTGALIQTKIVRAISASETVGKLEEIPVDLSLYTEGIYQVTYLNGGPTIEDVFCSPNYSPGTLAVLEMSYKTGAWTGANPQQQYVISVNSRNTDWFYDVYVHPSTLAIDANNLAMIHITGGTPISFNVVPGSIPVTNDFVQFKSVVQVPYARQPMHLQLTNSGNSIVDPMPLPDPLAVRQGVGGLITKVIVNV